VKKERRVKDWLEWPAPPTARTRSSPVFLAWKPTIWRRSARWRAVGNRALLYHLPQVGVTLDAKGESSAETLAKLQQLLARRLPAAA
jgi:hypothetical protein